MQNNLKICALLICVAAFGYWHVNASRKAVEAARSVLITQYDKSLKEATEKALRASNALQATADKKLEERDAKIKTINSKLDSALSELHNRPQRPSPEALAKSAVFGQACTARELYREDAEFLTREAARADTVVAERDYYYEQYEEVRKKLNGDSK